MRKITDEGFLFLYGMGLLMTIENGIPAVISYLLVCIYACTNLIWQKKYVHYIITAVFVGVGILCYKEMWLFLPVLFYNMLFFYTPLYLGVGGVLLACIGPGFYDDYGIEKVILILAGLFAAALLYDRTTKLEKLEQEYKKTRDDSKELTLMLEKKNQDLLEKQDTEVYLATLKERNRIAREIHDNVGHMLSRSILMVGALKAINQNEQLKVPMDQLDQTLNEAMTNVRQSVHDLHDESVNLKEVMESLAEEFTFCPVQLTYDMGVDVPKELKYSFIAIVKEALNNVMRHSHASEVKILVREHPWLYQLIIEDNGMGQSGIPDRKMKNSGSDIAGENDKWTGVGSSSEEMENQGIGIKNMKERVRMLNGTMQIHRRDGFCIFITIPKQKV